MIDENRSNSIMSKAHILIVDDEAEICALLAENLAGSQRLIEWTTHPEDILARLNQAEFDLILLDIKMPTISGLELLPRIKQAAPDCAVVMMSGYGNIPMAIEAMKRGAENFLEKPFRDLDEVKLLVSRLLETARVRIENRTLRRQMEEKYELGKLISVSPKMQEVFALVKKVAPLTATVLITGETGTGKELIARTLHHYSPRTARPFVAINCGGLPDGLLESLLFGHEKGSFTGALARTRGYFEEAEGGTLFLDEIGDMPLPLQMKLLRVLQQRVIQLVGSAEDIPVDVRLIAATHRQLASEVAAGRFRQDLFYRLNVIAIHVPPLRERQADIQLLAKHFEAKYSKAFGRPDTHLSAAAMDHLMQRAWPGNVRQLQNAIERAMALAGSSEIGPEAFEATQDDGAGASPGSMFRFPMRQACQQFERQYLLESLRRFDGNVTKAASHAGLPRQNFHRKMKQLGICALRPRKFKARRLETA